MNQVSAPVPTITSLLLSKGRNTVGHETNLARSPLWSLRKRAAHLETVVSPVLYGRPFRRVAGSPVTTADQQLFAHITTMFVRAGCPDDRKVPFSLGDAAIALGYDALGGKQRNLVRQSLARLGSVMLESAVRHPDGHETVLGWGLIESYLISTRGGGKGWVTISEAVRLLLREGSVTFLHAPTWNAITGEDDVAGRLWSFLESENLAKGWRYSLFPSETDDHRMMPTISEVVMLPWASRGEVSKRVRRACQVIEAHDRRYRLEVRTGQVPNSWVLHCSRTSQPSKKVIDGGLPAHLLRAWRDVYKSRLPSARQKSVLFELLDRHTSEWMVAALREGHKQGREPLRHLLDQDGLISTHLLGAAARHEECWKEKKRQENAEGEQSLAELLLAVDGIRPTRQ
ncbi:MAG: hypothetical protein ACYCS7_08760 [Acidimicrobiales bacterium]